MSGEDRTLRIVLGVVAGAVTGGVVVGLAAYLGDMVLAALGAAHVPLAQGVRACFAWGFAALAGGYIAARIAERSWAAWAIAALLLAALLYNLVVQPSPAALWIVGLAAIVVLGWLAGRIGASKAA